MVSSDHGFRFSPGDAYQFGAVIRRFKRSFLTLDGSPMFSDLTRRAGADGGLANDPSPDKKQPLGTSRRRRQTRSKTRRANRRPRLESLELRRMLVAEGAVFNLSAPVDTAGIVGNASALVDWGDGTTSAATITGGNQTGNLRVVFDYSLDTSRFFGTSANDIRRVRLQQAADALVSRFSDTLTAVAPAQFVTVRPQIFHPSLGPANSATGNLIDLPQNPTIAANTIIVFAGARDLPGAVRGVGGTSAINFSRTCIPGPQCDQAVASQNAIRSRGQAGVLRSSPDDVAPLFGSISFDAPTRDSFYYGDDPNGIAANQIDFLSVATHELAHVLGFGTSESWNRLTATGVFTGANARAAYVGSGNVPLVPGHWAPSVVALQPTLMGPSIDLGVRIPFSELDFASMQDLGWQLIDTSATVTATHRYADNGTYPVSVIVSGASIGDLTFPSSDAVVTNVAPTLTVVGNQTVTLGNRLSLANLGSIVDPGFRNGNADPATAETFTYVVDWGDGTVVDGNATIDRVGNATGQTTLASFDAGHTYTSVGNRTVNVTVRDDDGGTASRTFRVNVVAPPQLSLEIDRTTIVENAGSGAATLTVRRSGPALDANQTITLQSSDTSEILVPASIVIPAGQTSVTVPVGAVDDNLLDGSQTVTITASSTAAITDTIDVTVTDAEQLIVTLAQTMIREDQPNAASIVIRRSNTDLDAAIDVSIAGLDPGEISTPNRVTLAAGARQISVPIRPINDDDPERTQSYTLTLTSDAYGPVTVTFDLLDDEAPEFQNPVDRFDVVGGDGVSALDALRVINELAVRTNRELDPETENVDDAFFDVNGDYAVTALDALLVINQLAIRRANGSPINAEPESIDVAIAGFPLAIFPLGARQASDDDDWDWIESDLVQDQNRDQRLV